MYCIPLCVCVCVLLLCGRVDVFAYTFSECFRCLLLLGLPLVSTGLISLLLLLLQLLLSFRCDLNQRRHGDLQPVRSEVCTSQNAINLHHVFSFFFFYPDTD